MESKVCVTGAAGYLGSSLVKRLLEKGHIVHATTRNLGDAYKVGLLKSLPNAETRLRLYEADIYNPSEFQAAIEGCQFVVHMATPLQQLSQDSQFKDTTEAAVAAVKSIVECCITSGTVKRLIYTASVVASSPLKEDGEGFKDQLDESCWTSHGVALACSTDDLMAYASSKAASEKELLRYNGAIEIVSLALGLVGGGALLSTMPGSVNVLISQVTNNKAVYNTLRFLEELLGKVPFLHVEDPSINGRFLCATAYLSSAEIASHYRMIFPDIQMPDDWIEKVWGSTKLKDAGFEFKCDVKTILEDSINLGLKLGELKLPSSQI
ncbi:hypothetical protein CXB51_030217 [Gossypium anomalum]|uniref:NAD-dependent epimerase/dehydratase domain-containing protein n=1 Tax=Gossypium anomalum TaxID=47600 RepID=A0A8J5YX68_9ROSI|nr:hypothetical protein CXB51_030217 [Gossypium anomalum]